MAQAPHPYLAALAAQVLRALALLLFFVRSNYVVRGAMRHVWGQLRGWSRPAALRRDAAEVAEAESSESSLAR